MDKFYILREIDYLTAKLAGLGDEDHNQKKFVQHEIECLVKDIKRKFQEEISSKETDLKNRVMALVNEQKTLNNQLKFAINKNHLQGLEIHHLAQTNRDQEREIKVLNQQIFHLYRKLRITHSELPKDFAEYFLKEKEQKLNEYFQSQEWGTNCLPKPKESTLFNW